MNHKRKNLRRKLITSLTAAASCVSLSVPIAFANTYVVQPGDTLTSICGDYEKALEIAELNGIKDPNLIVVGQEIEIPDKKEEIDKETEEAMDALFEAINNLDAPEPTFEDLYEQVSDLDENDFDEEEWEKIAEAKETADEIASNEDASEDEIAEAVSEMSEIVEIIEAEDDEAADEVAEPETLDEFIETVDALEEEDYTEESWTVLNDALAEAVKVSEDKEATNVEIEESMDALAEAYADLEEPELSLRELYDLACTINEEDYSEKSWAVLVEARDKVLEIIEAQETEKAAQEEAAKKAAEQAESSNNIVSTAKSMLGTKYVWGGYSANGVDCSGFVYYVLNHCGNGWSAARGNANSLRSHCTIISKSELQPGDLIFFKGTYKTSGASHVGIYIGDGQMIHASSSKGCVITSSINTNYWNAHYLECGRFTG